MPHRTVRIPIVPGVRPACKHPDELKRANRPAATAGTCDAENAGAFLTFPLDAIATAPGGAPNQATIARGGFTQKSPCACASLPNRFPRGLTKDRTVNEWLISTGSGFDWRTFQPVVPSSGLRPPSPARGEGCPGLPSITPQERCSQHLPSPLVGEGWIGRRPRRMRGRPHARTFGIVSGKEKPRWRGVLVRHRIDRLSSDSARP